MNVIHDGDPLRGVPMEALRTFEAAAQHLNFTRAAAELNLTQSAVSHAIRALEARVGARLFSREKGRLDLTAAGSSLRGDVRAALALLRGAIRRAGEAQPVHVVSVRVTRSAGVGWLIPRIVGFNRLFPGIDVRTALAPRTGSPEDRAMSAEKYLGGCDLAIRLQPRESAKRDEKPLAMEYILPCCTPALAGTGTRRAQSIDELLQRPLIEFEDGLVPLSGNWSVWAALVGVTLPREATMVRVPDWASVYALAARGKGVCLGRTPQVSHDLRNGTLVAPVPEVLRSKEAFYLIRPPGAESRPDVSRFLDWLIGEFDAEKAFEAELLRGRRVVDPLVRRGARGTTRSPARRSAPDSGTR